MRLLLVTDDSTDLHVVLKVLGAAVESGMSFDGCMSLGNALKDQLVSIATTLDHCHVPGRAETGWGQLESTTIEIGTGPHNEPVSHLLLPNTMLIRSRAT